MNEVLAVDLGTMEYRAAWEIQRRVFNARVSSAVPDVLLFTEHKHVYTIGKNGTELHLLADTKELEARGAEVVPVDRGGDITYHGPGQLVGYPILDLNGYTPDLHRYLRDLEETLILTLAEYGISGDRDPGLTGVWVGNEKIAALGIKANCWVTMHGFALNVTTDLTYFDRIIPCGIFHKGVTSMEKVLGRDIPLGDVTRTYMTKFAQVFEVSMKECTSDALRAMYDHYQLENQECHHQENQYSPPV